MSIQLRDYQSATIAKLWQWFRDHPEGHPIVEACVGAGKSLMIAETIRQALEWPDTRVLMLVASRELCRQNAEKLIAIWPEAPVGIYSAGLKSRQLDKRIVYATIGSVHKRWHQLGHVSLIMIDECHQVSAKDQGMYRDLIRNLLTVCPALRVIGWTGTAFHGTGVWLHDAEQRLFTDIAARVTMRELLDQGYLAPLITPRTDTRLIADGVGTRGGDYIVSQLAKAIDKRELVNACANELMSLGAERKRWFVYGATIAHCEHIRDALTERGISSALISAKTPHAERDATLALLKSGRLRAIVNVATMTTGIDVPELDLIALMRNTQSPVLYTQIAGRGMRTAPGKQDCLLVDFTDTVATLGPVDLVKGKARSKRERGEAPFKVCGACGASNHTTAHECVECGAPFELEEKPRHNARASNAPALSSDTAPRIERHEVYDVIYERWPSRKGGPDTLRVTYRGPFMRIASEWICFEHQGYPRTKAVSWWSQRCPIGTPVPKTIDEALSHAQTLRKPVAIDVDTRSKYPEIKSYEWDQPDAAANAA